MLNVTYRMGTDRDPAYSTSSEDEIYLEDAHHQTFDLITALGLWS